MKQHKGKFICGLMILSIVFFIWNDSLYDKKPAYPLEKERVAMIWLHTSDESRKALDETQKDALLDAINSLALVPDQEWRETLKSSDEPFMSEPDLYRLTMTFHTDFFHRVDYTLWAFYDEGRVMMNAVSAMRPYPYLYGSTDYDHLKLDKATNDTYDELLNLLAELTGYMTGDDAK